MSEPTGNDVHAHAMRARQAEHRILDRYVETVDIAHALEISGGRVAFNAFRRQERARRLKRFLLRFRVVTLALALLRRTERPRSRA